MTLKFALVPLAFLLSLSSGTDSKAAAESSVGKETVAKEITGAGSTFAYPIVAKWAEAFRAKTGIAVNYQSIGSGGGIKQIQAKTVAFGATDKPLTPEELSQSKLVQFPFVVGGVVAVVNVPGLKAGQLKLSGELLADIYLGQIKKWNDAKLVELNPGVALPDRAIAVVHRADGSGTSFLWTNYLSKVSADWKAQVGEGAAVKWPTGMGGKGNEGVASYVQRIPGAIGYVEYAYALQNKMIFAQLKNRAGQYVSPSQESFSAASASADWAGAKDFYLVLTDAPGAKSWPVVGATFALVEAQSEKPEQVRAAVKFFEWSLREGQKLANELDYVPLPAAVVKKVEAAWKSQIKGPGGKAL